MPQPAGTGTLDQVLTLLRKLAMTPAYGTVLAATVAAAAPTKSVYTLRDRFNLNQPLVTIDLAEEDPATDALYDLSWADTGFAQAIVAQTLRMAAPFPLIEFIGAPGSYMRGDMGDMEDADFAVVSYVVDAVVFAGGDQQRIVERKALLLAEAFRRLIRKDECLGGLVMQMRPRGPVEPGGGGPHKETAVIMAARIRFDVRCILAP